MIAVRRILVDSETREHSWAIPVMRWLPTPCFIFDGIAGDILGDPVGWTIHTGLSVEARSAEDELEAIVTSGITDHYDSVLSSEQWPSVSDLREDVKTYLRAFLPRSNISEIAFLLLRQRRVIAPWSQQLAPPGHVPLCPYLDLDYLRLLLGFVLGQAHHQVSAGVPPKEFGLTSIGIPATGTFPSMAPGSPALRNTQTLHSQATLLHEIGAYGGLPALYRLLTMRGRVGLSLARRECSARLWDRWYPTPLMELASRSAPRGRAGKLVELKPRF